MLENISQRTVRAAQIFIGALPILMVYPFLQRFFVKGIVIGAVKE
jgi:putative aldouronate transport system permease protein